MNPSKISFNRVALTTFILGVIGLTLELSLRSYPSIHLISNYSIFYSAIAGFFIGLSIRARNSMAGDFSINVDLVKILSIVVFSLPTVMLAFYSIAFALSLLLVFILYALWGIGFLLAWLIQLIIWSGVIIVIGVVGEENGGEPWAIVIIVSLFLFVISILGKLIGGSVFSPWNCSLPHWEMSLLEKLPEWLFLFDKVRSSLAGMDFALLVSVIATLFLSFVSALISALTSRWIRQKLMLKVKLRPFLPLAAAPLSDSTPFLPKKLILPSIPYIFLAWVIFIWHEVL